MKYESRITLCSSHHKKRCDNNLSTSTANNFHLPKKYFRAGELQEAKEKVPSVSSVLVTGDEHNGKTLFSSQRGDSENKKNGECAAVRNLPLTSLTSSSTGTVHGYYNQPKRMVDSSSFADMIPRQKKLSQTSKVGKGDLKMVVAIQTVHHDGVISEVE